MGLLDNLWFTGRKGFIRRKDPDPQPAVVGSSLSPEVILSSLIRTAGSGGRVEIDKAGIRLYDPDDVLVTEFRTADGSAEISGKFSNTHPSGGKWEADHNGIRLYDPSGNLVVDLKTADGSAEITGGIANAQSGKNRVVLVRAPSLAHAGISQIQFERTARETPGFLNTTDTAIAMFAPRDSTWGNAQVRAQASSTGSHVGLRGQDGVWIERELGRAWLLLLDSSVEPTGAAGAASLFSRIVNSKVELCVKFPTGAVQVIGTEP